VIAYVDASVLLRVVLRQRESLREWAAIETGVASALVEVECLRTLDRLRLAAGIEDEALALRRDAVYRLTEALEIVEPTLPVLRRAAQPLPTALGTLDAIHLATAVLWRELRGQDLVMATHDRALGLAAQASGLRVVGL
jgi:predicted nucleic acid-binding protein